jgi:hypothetical protein
MLTMPFDDGEYWPKHVQAQIFLASIKIVTLDRLLLFIYVLRGITVEDVCYKDITHLLRV